MYVVPTPSLGEGTGGLSPHLLHAKSTVESRRNAWLATKGRSLWQGQAPGVEHAGCNDDYGLLVDVWATTTQARLGLMVG
jgi:hypothetical protein